MTKRRDDTPIPDDDVVDDMIEESKVFDAQQESAPGMLA